MIKELSEKITLEDVPEKYKDIVRIIGIESLIKLCGYAGRTTIYIPTPASLIINVRNGNIIQEYNGYNHRMLAKKYCLTDEQIKGIVKKNKVTNRKACGINDKIIKELSEKITMEDLPENAQNIAELIGMNNLIKLSQYAGGSKIYMCIPETIVRNVRNRAILNECKGKDVCNTKQLSIKYGLSCSQIRLIKNKLEVNKCVD